MFNEDEARAIVSMMLDLKRRSTFSIWSSPDALRVVTGYKTQVAVLNKLFLQDSIDVQAYTVDSTQKLILSSCRWYEAVLVTWDF